MYDVVLRASAQFLSHFRIITVFSYCYCVVMTSVLSSVCVAWMLFNRRPLVGGENVWESAWKCGKVHVPSREHLEITSDEPELVRFYSSLDDC